MRAVALDLPLTSLPIASASTDFGPRLLLAASLREVLDTGGEGLGWAELAAELAGACDIPALSGPQLAAAAALQGVLAELLDACSRCSPARFEELAGLCVAEPTLASAWGSLVELWPRGEAADRAKLGLFLVVLARNRALAPLDLLAGLQDWRSGTQLGEAAAALLRLERGLPLGPSQDSCCADLLLLPWQACPDSVEGQLRWALENWGDRLSEGARQLAVLALDLGAEAAVLRVGGPGPVQPPGLFLEAAGGGPGSEPADKELFSRDADWMPQLVLVAKHTLVWLEQLSRSWDRPVDRLDRIPDEELDRLAERGFTGLWLIGLWERSPASRAIKVRRGQAEAQSSAYSLRDCRIAPGLGGEEALDALRERAARRGIRLAADMVPNHTGLDSRWMVEHPDRFLSLPRPPYPGYRFTGPNLSGDARIEVYLEDGYWDESDAAVVFKRVDPTSGEVRFVYHGNDGTQMPWNDTAQLDYLQAEVREAVTEAVLEVARRFPIIRFDAAMTLARQHVARLWHPPPGQGGAIPSRAEHGVAAEDFDRAMPREFWRELVDRVAEEAPDTLLLAEAFWMMEGYFVRNLGMHRVYNSAFMHMLRDEDNAGYRAVLREVLERSPAVLQRYVNFMNNPDEETAAQQFGRGDKYFGVATLLSTLPGLPMFGHGQLEGFAEKYGMEYGRARCEEAVDAGLLEHHERVIVPLLRARRLFCGALDFALFDFRAGDRVDENVFAYSNRSAGEREASLVLYNNSAEASEGWIQESTPRRVGGREDSPLECTSLGEALGLRPEPGLHCALRELRRGAWTIRTSQELCGRGFFARLAGYEAQVFTEIRSLADPEGRVASLAARLGGGWVEDLEAALNEEGEEPR